jgi:hypothetical protein
MRQVCGNGPLEGENKSHSPPNGALGVNSAIGFGAPEPLTMHDHAVLLHIHASAIAARRQTSL